MLFIMINNVKTKLKDFLSMYKILIYYLQAN